MGTNATTYLQNEIKSLLKKIGWSISRFSEVLHAELYDEYEELDYPLKSFKEKVKKQLDRASTNQEILEQYLHILQRDKEFIKTGIVIPLYLSSGELDIEIEKELYQVSRDLSEIIKAKNR